MAQFQDDHYDLQPGVLPKGPLWSGDIPLKEASASINAYFEESIHTVEMAPRGHLRYPFFVPGATYDELWDWDTLFTVYGTSVSEKEYILGSAKILLEAPTLENGHPSKMVSAAGDYLFVLHPYPIRAQLACAASAAIKDYDWIEPYYPILCHIMNYYETQCADRKGFFRWMHLSGIDNDPSVYGRKPGTTAGVDLASFHVREYRAMATIARHLGKPEAAEYLQKARALNQLIQTQYYDMVDGFFYAVDRGHSEGVITQRQFVTWNAFLKYRGCSSLFVLWSRSATSEQARSMRNYVMNEAEFLAPAGVRSHSKRDAAIYNNALSGGPSNWQGPVWGLITPLVAYGLNAYGYHDDAMEIAGRLVKTMARDLKQNGCLHEYYHGDTSQPVLKPGFLSFNLMAYRLMENLEAGIDPTEAGIDPFPSEADKVF